MDDLTPQEEAELAALEAKQANKPKSEGLFGKWPKVLLPGQPGFEEQNKKMAEMGLATAAGSYMPAEKIITPLISKVSSGLGNWLMRKAVNMPKVADTAEKGAVLMSELKPGTASSLRSQIEENLARESNILGENLDKLKTEIKVPGLPTSSRPVQPMGKSTPPAGSSAKRAYEQVKNLNYTNPAEKAIKDKVMADIKAAATKEGNEEVTKSLMRQGAQINAKQGLNQPTSNLSKMISLGKKVGVAAALTPVLGHVAGPAVGAGMMAAESPLVVSSLANLVTKAPIATDTGLRALIGGQLQNKGQTNQGNATSQDLPLTPEEEAELKQLELKYGK